MKRAIAFILVSALTLLFVPVSLAQKETFTYQRGPVFVYVLQDGTAEVGVLYLVKNNDEMPLYFAAFRASVLDKEGNTLTTTTMDSCAPRFIMPGQFGYVWCTSQSDEFAPEQLGGMAAPQAECFGFPDLTDASEDYAVSDEKCEVIPLENGESTISYSATVTNTGRKELSGRGGYFLMEGIGENPATFPIIFKDDALLGKLAPGESVRVSAELSRLSLYSLQMLGYDSINTDELRFTTHAFASKVK